MKDYRSSRFTRVCIFLSGWFIKLLSGWGWLNWYIRAVHASGLKVLSISYISVAETLSWTFAIVTFLGLFFTNLMNWPSALVTSVVVLILVELSFFLAVKFLAWRRKSKIKKYFYLLVHHLNKMAKTGKSLPVVLESVLFFDEYYYVSPEINHALNMAKMYRVDLAHAFEVVSTMTPLKEYADFLKGFSKTIKDKTWKSYLAKQERLMRGLHKKTAFTTWTYVFRHARLRDSFRWYHIFSILAGIIIAVLVTMYLYNTWAYILLIIVAAIIMQVHIWISFFMDYHKQLNAEREFLKLMYFMKKKNIKKLDEAALKFAKQAKSINMNAFASDLKKNNLEKAIDNLGKMYHSDMLIQMSDFISLLKEKSAVELLQDVSGIVLYARRYLENVNVD